MQCPHFMKMASPIYYDAQRRMNILNKTLLMTALIAVGLTASTAHAAKGKAQQIKLVNTGMIGSASEKYSRTIARHLYRFIPGKPKITIQSIVGAGGIKATNFAYNAMPRNVAEHPVTTGYHRFIASLVAQGCEIQSPAFFLDWVR
jgi:tripartite-type tricarboxylate transporter receptor subunit TctC